MDQSKAVHGAKSSKGLPQYGGERSSADTNSHKSDMTLKQPGGERKEEVVVKPLDAAFTPGRQPVEKYTGPGRNLQKESF